MCNKDGGPVDLTGYEISYIDRQHERHYVDYLSAKEAGKMKYEIQNTIKRELDEAYQKRLSYEAYKQFGRNTNKAAARTGGKQ